jgi:hypothetical protein
VALTVNTKETGDMLQRMFSWQFFTKYTAEMANHYFKELSKVQSKRYGYLLSHKTIQKVIASQLERAGWQTKMEVTHGDFDSHHRFDVVARNGEKTIIVEVKPEITPKIVGTVLPYLTTMKSKMKNTRLILGTDIWNLDVICSEPVLSMAKSYASHYKAGIFLTDSKNAWLLPEEIIPMINGWGHPKK